MPSSAARRWIMRQASTRFMGLSVSIPVRPGGGAEEGSLAVIAYAGRLYIGVEIGFQVVMRRHLVAFAAFFVQADPPALSVLDSNPQRAWRRRRRCERRRRSSPRSA